MPSVFSKELRVATKASLEAARRIRSMAGKLPNTQIREKALNDLVTTADTEVQELIIRNLRKAFPQHEFLAEEGQQETSTGRPRWIIDPIDGTINFSRGLAPYAVSVALEVDGLVQVGVVVEASTDELFTAVRGGGAYRNGEPIKVSANSRLAQSLVATGYPYKDFLGLLEYVEILGRFMLETRGVRRCGAASVDLAYVACGVYDGFFESGLSVWDIAAGRLLVEEAGGRVTDFSGIKHGREPAQIVASNTWVHEEIVLLLVPLTQALNRARG